MLAPPNRGKGGGGNCGGNCGIPVCRTRDLAVLACCPDDGLPAGRDHRPSQPGNGSPERPGVRIFRHRDPQSCPVTPAVFRASAGAAAHVPVVQVTNLARAVDELQESGFWIYAAVMDGETDVSTFAPAQRTGFVLGGEDTGIRRLVREKCDGTVRIPMEAGIDSLNVGVTSGILAFCARVVRAP